MLNERLLIVLGQRKVHTWDLEKIRIFPKDCTVFQITHFLYLFHWQVLLERLSWKNSFSSCPWSESNCFSLYLFQRAICSAPRRSFCCSPRIVWWGANTLIVPYTFISDVYLRVLGWDAFCFHRTSSKNTTKLGCQGDYMKPKWYIWYLILKARLSKNSVYSCAF